MTGLKRLTIRDIVYTAAILMLTWTWASNSIGQTMVDGLKFDGYVEQSYTTHGVSTPELVVVPSYVLARAFAFSLWALAYSLVSGSGDRNRRILLIHERI